MPIDLFRNALVDDTPGPDEVALAQVRRARVRQALEAVPTDQREALVLRYLQGFSVRAIAGVAGASESAVKMRLKRGRETLRRAFGPEHTPSPDATSR
jgi:RNA polymerase sigma-70 factor (ECF subfamily)